MTPGETILVETVDSSGGQLDAQSGLKELEALDFGKVNPVTGPILVGGAEPGDAVAVTFKAFHPSGWGWTANIPGFGLLADDLPRPGAAYLELRYRAVDTVRLRRRREGAAEAFRRHHRAGAE